MIQLIRAELAKQRAVRDRRTTAKLRRWAVFAPLLGLITLLAGCTTPQPGLDPPQINALLLARGAPALSWEQNQSAADAALISGWLAEPMTSERAVRVALLRSPRLQEEYARLGLARADIIEAVQIANPRLSVSRLDALGGSGNQFGLGLSLPLVDLLVLPMRKRLAQADFERAKLAIAASVQEVGFDVEQAWYAFVGANQVAQMRAAVASNQEISAELARRFYAAGNISELQLSREEAAASQARIDAARAQIASRSARLSLNLLIGLHGPDAGWQTSDTLPLPVEVEDDPAALAALANRANFSLMALTREVDILRRSAAMTKNLRLLGNSEIGFEREREVGGAVIQGPTLNLELPIFNQGGARVARALARHALAQAQLQALQIKIDNAVRFGAERLRALSDIVNDHRKALIPARETVVERSQFEQNFMLIGVFELIQAKTQEYDAYQGYLEAIADYWLARVELMRVVGARLPSESQASAPSPSVADILKPRGQAMGHQHHGMTPATPDNRAEMPGSEMPGMDHKRSLEIPAPAPPHQGHHQGQKQENPA